MPSTSRADGPSNDRIRASNAAGHCDETVTIAVADRPVAIAEAADDIERFQREAGGIDVSMTDVAACVRSMGGQSLKVTVGLDGLAPAAGDWSGTFRRVGMSPKTDEATSHQGSSLAEEQDRVLHIRGICTLRPGVPGMSEHIAVRSILGRFLEHSRVYRFGDGDDDELWIGSADMMHRTLDRRVEALVRVDDATHRARLRSLLELAATDPTAWRLGPDGSWTHERVGAETGMQAALMARARAS